MAVIIEIEGVIATPSASDPATTKRMKAVKLSGSEAELRVRAAFSTAGVRYRLNDCRFPGTPDLCNATRNIAVFVHGCFWHRHSGCCKATTPKKNRRFWLQKFESNKKRDRSKARKLTRMGFSILTIWECETKSPERLQRKVDSYLDALGRRRAS